MSTATVTKIEDGPRHAVFHVFIEGDAGGDITGETIIDPAELEPAKANVPTLTIQKLWYDIGGFDILLSFDYLASDTPVWSIGGDQSGYLDFIPMGGLKDRSAQDGTGKLELSTFGLTEDQYGTLIVHVRKD